MKMLPRALFLLLMTMAPAIHTAAVESEPPASPEVTAAMKPYLDSYKHLRNGMFGHDGAYGTDLSVNPNNGMVAVFMVQCPGPDQWAARDLFLKTATQVFQKDAP